MNGEGKMKIEVGKRYRVKSWERMVEEYGYEFGTTNVIDTPAKFVKEMEEFCGTIVTIKNKDSGFYDIKEGEFLWDECMLLPAGPIAELLEKEGEKIG